MEVKKKTGTEILKVFTLSKGGLQQITKEDALFELATQQALQSFQPERGSPSSVYVIPIGIYLDTSEKEVVESAKNFWKNALDEEGFVIIGEREVSGSWLITLLAATRNTKERKKRVSRLTKKAVEFVKKFENVTRVVVLGTMVIAPAPRVEPPKPSPPITEVMPAQQSKDAWKTVVEKIKQGEEEAEIAAGGLLALYELAKKKKEKEKGKKE